MSTIEQLVEGKILVPWEISEWERRTPLRSFLHTPELLKWFRDTPRTHDRSIVKGGRTPWEHYQLFFNDVCCARRPCVGDMKRLEPTKNGLWKAHPPTLRVFGWCYAKDSFVGITAALEVEIKDRENTITYKSETSKVESFIKKHNLEHTILRGGHLDIFTN